MNQQRVPDTTAENQHQRQALARITDAYDRLPRLFAVPVDDGTTHPAGTVAAWGIELPDGTAITCDPNGGGAFGTWESPINAAAMLGSTRPIYLGGPEAWPYA